MKGKLLKLVEACINDLIKIFSANPYLFYTENDLHCCFYTLLSKRLEDSGFGLYETLDAIQNCKRGCPRSCSSSYVAEQTYIGFCNMFQIEIKGILRDKIWRVLVWNNGTKEQKYKRGKKREILHNKLVPIQNT